MNGNGIWKTAAVTLAGMFLTGASAWVSIARDVVTEPEMVRYINTSAPYIEDRKLLNDRMEDIRNMRDEIQELRRALERIEAQLEQR